jgi:hypothetical protein
LEGAETWKLRKTEKKHGTQEIMNRGAVWGKRDGWYKKRRRGSHGVKERPTYNEGNTVFTHKKDLEFLTRIPVRFSTAPDRYPVTTHSPKHTARN